MWRIYEMPESDIDNIIKSIIDTTEEIKIEAFKREKGSLDNKFLEYIMTRSTAYTRLIKKLQEKSIISTDNTKQMADYLYHDFVVPISNYLGFMEIPILTKFYKEPWKL